MTSGPGRPAGSLSGPGTLSGVTPVGEVTPLPDEPLAELAAQYGLRPSALRPPLLTYIRQLWQRRHFILTFATARNVAMYTEARLGQLWQVLTPLLNAGVYFLIFGVLLGTSRGVPNYPRVPGHRGLHLQLHPAIVPGRLAGHQRPSLADPGADTFPAPASHSAMSWWNCSRRCCPCSCSSPSCLRPASRSPGTGCW